MNGFEIECKFLIKKGGVFKHAAFSSNRIQQRYIPHLNAMVRIRVRDDEVYLTIKGKPAHGRMTRYEFKTKITLEETSHLLRPYRRDIIDKRRYLVKSGNYVLEVDELYGDNEGLAVAEMELKSEDEPYEKSDFIGPEVTEDACFYNKYIPMNPFSAWRDTLSEEY